MASELQHVTIYRVIFRGQGIHKCINANSNIAQEEGVSMALEEQQRWLQFIHATGGLGVVRPTNRVVLVGGAAPTVDELRRVMQDEFAVAPSSGLALSSAADGRLVIEFRNATSFADVTCSGLIGQQAIAKLKHLLPPPLLYLSSLEQSVEPGGSGSPVADRPTVSRNSSGRSATIPEAATAKSAVAAAAAPSSADPPGPDGLLSSFSGLEISPTASPGGTTTPDFATRSVDSMRPPVSRHDGQERLSTVSHSQQPSAAESLTDAAAAALPRDIQLQASPNSNMLPSSAVQRVPRSSSSRFRLTWESAFRRTRRTAYPTLTVDVRCIRLSDVEADVYVLPTNCEADFTRDIHAKAFYSSISLSPPIGTCFPAGTCLAQRLSFCSLSGSFGVFLSVPDRSKLGESADELLSQGICVALTTANERGFDTVAMLPLGVYYGAFAPEDAARLTYRGILAFCQARKKFHVSRLIVAVPRTDLLKIYTNAFSCGFDVVGPRYEYSQEENPKNPIDPEVIVTLCGTASGVLAAVTRLVEKVMEFRRK